MTKSSKGTCATITPSDKRGEKVYLDRKRAKRIFGLVDTQASNPFFFSFT